MSESVNQFYLLGSFSCIEDFVLCLYCLLGIHGNRLLRDTLFEVMCNKKLFGKASLLVCVLSDCWASGD